MQLNIFAIGKMKAGSEQDLLERYLERSKKSAKQIGINIDYIRELPESRAGQSDVRKSQEAQKILSSIPSDTILLALDENGEDLPSRQLAKLLETYTQSGNNVAFAIGGPDGHGQEVLSRADKTIRFGRQTWPHQLVRIMVSEQIYRAITILTNHPYHRD